MRRRRWDLSDADPPVQILGKCRQQIAIPPEEILDIRDVIEHWAADDHAAFPHRMAPEGERGDHAEVAATTPERPEQITVRLGARGDEAAVGQHHISGYQIVDRQAEAAGEVAHSPAERQSGDARSGHEARGQCHPERTRGMINITPDATGVDSNGASLRIDRGAAEAAKVNDEGVVPDAESTAVVCAASDGQRQHVVARVCHAGHHVSDISAPHDRERVTIHCTVVDSSGRLIARIICGDDRAAYIGKIISG